MVLTHPDGEIQIEELGEGRRRVSVNLRDPGVFIPRASWVTSYPEALIELILDVKGPVALCDEITRDENPDSLSGCLARAISAYLPDDDFTDKDILDFGCGCGASTMVLGRLFPNARRIVGADMSDRALCVGEARCRYYGFSNMVFQLCPREDCLPEGIGRFDYVVLNGVYEHLLPEERRALLPQLWSIVKPSGVLLLDETPSRSFPIEVHTTGLPLINYLPDGLVLFLARRLSRRVAADEPWQKLLRRGIRGGTVGEVMRVVSAGGGDVPKVLSARGLGCRDRIDLWHLQHRGTRSPRVRLCVKHVLKILKCLIRVSWVPELSLAIRKQDGT